MTSEEETFSITNETDGDPEISGLPFFDMKQEILGPEYDLSLVFIEDEKSRALNNDYREKDYPTNVLSFPVGESIGEIFINVDAVEREHDDYDRSMKHFIGFLFIHACMHLKGYEHGSKMEEQEKKIRARYKI